MFNSGAWSGMEATFLRPITPGREAHAHKKCANFCAQAVECASFCKSGPNCGMLPGFRRAARARPADPTEKVCRPQGSNLGPLRCQASIIPTFQAGAKKVVASGGPSTGRASARWYRSKPQKVKNRKNSHFRAQHIQGSRNMQKNLTVCGSITYS